MWKIILLPIITFMYVFLVNVSFIVTGKYIKKSKTFNNVVLFSAMLTLYIIAILLLTNLTFILYV